METGGVKYLMTKCGLESPRSAAVQMRIHPSHVYCEGGLGSQTVVESFTINTPDGSTFLVQITKLSK